MATQAVTPQPTQWDAQGNPVQPSPSGNVTEWDANGKPTQTGQVTNDVGNTVIVPRPGESFADTMARGRAMGATVTQDMIDKEMATAPKKVAQTLVAAPVIGAVGAAGLAGAGEAAAATPAAAVPVARGIGTAAGVAVRLARTPIGKAALEYTLKAVGAGAGYAFAKKWLGL